MSYDLPAQCNKAQALCEHFVRDCFFYGQNYGSEVWIAQSNSDVVSGQAEKEQFCRTTTLVSLFTLKKLKMMIKRYEEQKSTLN